MFPAIQVRFHELENEKNYVIYLDIVPVDWYRYRYAYHRSQWLIAGKADTLMSGQLYQHPDTPLTGYQLNNHLLSFDKLKLTNNPDDKNGHVSIMF